MPRSQSAAETRTHSERTASSPAVGKLVTEALHYNRGIGRINLSAPKVSQTRRRAAARCEGVVPAVGAMGKIGGMKGGDERTSDKCLRAPSQASGLLR